MDECVGPTVAHWLGEQGHQVFSVYHEARGIDDDRVIQQAYAESRILITSDKDFGEKVYRERRPHKGVVLLRVRDERATKKIEVLRRLLERHAQRLGGRFVVVTDVHIRFARG